MKYGCCFYCGSAIIIDKQLKEFGFISIYTDIYTDICRVYTDISCQIGLYIIRGNLPSLVCLARLGEYTHQNLNILLSYVFNFSPCKGSHFF